MQIVTGKALKIKAGPKTLTRYKAKYETFVNNMCIKCLIKKKLPLFMMCLKNNSKALPSCSDLLFERGSKERHNQEVEL